MQLRFDRVPSEQALCEALDAAIRDVDYFGDVHGSASYKRHLTYYFAEQIRAELQQ
jgi:CO/xanthine dehydrogenase FAD-binding subunit